MSPNPPVFRDRQLRRRRHLMKMADEWVGFLLGAVIIGLAFASITILSIMIGILNK